MCHVRNASHKVQMRLSQPLGGERDPHGEETLHKECAAKVWKHLKIHYSPTRVLLLYIYIIKLNVFLRGVGGDYHFC